MSWKSLALAIAVSVTLCFVVPAIAFPIIGKILNIPIHGIEGVEFAMMRLRGFPMPLPVFLSLDTYLVTGFSIAGISMGIYIYLRDAVRKVEALKRQLLEFIPLIASYIRTGAPISQALELSLAVIRQPLASYVERFVKLVRLGEDPAKAFDKVFADVPREVRVIMSSIVIAMVSGGRVAEVLEEAERYVSQLTRMDDLRRHRLAEYKMILIMAVIAFAFAGVVTLKLIASISGLATSFPGAMAANVNVIATSYFIASLFLSIVSSIVVSRMITGYTLLAFKYIAMLSIAVTAMYIAKDFLPF